MTATVCASTSASRSWASIAGAKTQISAKATTTAVEKMPVLCSWPTLAGDKSLRADAPEFVPGAEPVVETKPVQKTAMAMPTKTRNRRSRASRVRPARSTKPAPRRDVLSDYPRCCGHVLAIMAHYGWIASLDQIDHPELGRNGGRLYFSYDDVAASVDVSTLSAGAMVSFQLYVDAQGLGCTDIRVESPAHGRCSSYSSSADEEEEAPIVESKDEFWEEFDDEAVASWEFRNLAASAKLRAEVGDDIRWDLMLDVLKEYTPANALRCSLGQLDVQTISSRGGSTRSPSSTGSDHGDQGTSSDTDSSSESGCDHSVDDSVTPPPGLCEDTLALMAPPGLWDEDIDDSEDVEPPPGLEYLSRVMVDESLPECVMPPPGLGVGVWQ